MNDCDRRRDGEPGIGQASEVPTHRFFVLTGIDAAGKTTLLSHLGRRRPDWEIGSYEPSDWLPNTKLPHFDWALQVHPRRVVHDLQPHARAALLLSIILTHFQYWIRPRLEDGKVVVMDSYYYRFCAKERRRAIVPEFFYEALRTLPDADTAIIAEVAPEIAFERKAVLDLHEYDRNPSAEDFVRFQSDVSTILKDLCQRGCACVKTIDATASIDSAVAALINTVEARLAETHTPDPLSDHG